MPPSLPRNERTGPLPPRASDRRRGAAARELLLVVMLVALAATGSLAGVGTSFRTAVAGNATGSPSQDSRSGTALAGASPLATRAPLAAQAGAVSGAADLASSVAGGVRSASRTLQDSAKLDLGFAARLPERGSPAYRKFVAQLESAFDPKSGPGFAVLRTRDFMPEAAATAFERLGSGKRTLDYDPHYGMNHRLFGGNSAGLGAYHQWIEDLIADALGGGTRRFPQRKLHVQLEGPRTPSDFGWHIDGAPVTALWILDGKGTDFVPLARGEARTIAGAERLTKQLGERMHLSRAQSLAQGDLLIFAGRNARGALSDGFRSTFRDLPPLVHRTPNGTDASRTLLVTRFDLPSRIAGR
jgi:hypothetical protein